MALKDALENLRKAEQEVARLVEEEEAKANGKPVYWRFVYEQKWTDAEGWGWNDQLIHVCDVEEAFQVFGHVLKVYGLTVRNIRYGLESEMEEEMERVRAWREQEFGKGKK